MGKLFSINKFFVFVSHSQYRLRGLRWLSANRICIYFFLLLVYSKTCLETIHSIFNASVISFSYCWDTNVLFILRNVFGLILSILIHCIVICFDSSFDSDTLQSNALRQQKLVTLWPTKLTCTTQTPNVKMKKNNWLWEKTIIKLLILIDCQKQRETFRWVSTSITFYQLKREHQQNIIDSNLWCELISRTKIEMKLKKDLNVWVCVVVVGADGDKNSRQQTTDDKINEQTWYRIIDFSVTEMISTNKYFLSNRDIVIFFFGTFSVWTEETNAVGIDPSESNDLWPKVHFDFLVLFNFLSLEFFVK